MITEIPQALSSICDALVDKTSLYEINLSDNAFGGRSVNPIVPFLTQNRSFSVLKLNNNGLGPAGGAVIADALLQSAHLSKKEGKPSNLRTVICGRNRLEDGSATTWAEAFAAHGTLVDVRMPQNGIRQDGVIALARGLAKCPNLQTLDLQDNAFNVDGSDEGSKAFAEALPSWSKLEILDFSDCVLTEEGNIPSVISTLAGGSNPALHTLRLQNNNLDSQTAVLLAETVGEHLPLLKFVELQWNEIEEDEEALETLGDLLKARGGKLAVTDEDEEDDDEVEKEAAESEPDEGKPTTATDKAADQLAELLEKVSIS